MKIFTLGGLPIKNRLYHISLTEKKITPVESIEVQINRSLELDSKEPKNTEEDADIICTTVPLLRVDIKLEAHILRGRTHLEQPQ